MKPIYIARHGDRIDFVNPKWLKTAEHPDDPYLAKRGHVQAKELAARLEKEILERPCILFSSPFQRCVATASYIADALDIEINIEPGICEILEVFPPGYRTLEDLATEFPRINKSYQPILTPNKEEHSDWDCFTRVTPMVGYFQTMAEESTVVIVSHGAPCTGLLYHWTGKITYPGLCTVSKMVSQEEQQQGKYVAEYVWNESHLSDRNNLRAW